MSSAKKVILKWFNIAIWILLLGGLFVLLGMARSAQNEMTCAEVLIRLEQEEEAYFTDREAVARILGGDAGVEGIKGQRLALLDAGEMEQLLEQNRYIRRAEVFSTLNGVLNIAVEQRQPLFRVFRQNSKGYYVDRDGMKMPLSENYSARVMVLRGAIAEAYEGDDTIKSKALQEAWLLINTLNRDTFWPQQIEEVQYDLNGEFTLIPKIGDQIIRFGKAEDIDGKLHKLKLFYKYAMPQVGWSTYKVINLKYSGQVVCEK